MPTEEQALAGENKEYGEELIPRQVENKRCPSGLSERCSGGAEETRRMIRHRHFGALCLAVFAATLRAYDVRMSGRCAIGDRKLIAPEGVGDGGGRAHLVCRIIRVVERDGHCHHLRAAAACEASCDRDVVPDKLVPGGGGGGDGREAFYAS